MLEFYGTMITENYQAHKIRSLFTQIFEIKCEWDQLINSQA